MFAYPDGCMTHDLNIDPPDLNIVIELDLHTTNMQKINYYELNIKKNKKTDNQHYILAGKERPGKNIDFFLFQ